jgi:hypothetical protein
MANACARTHTETRSFRQAGDDTSTAAQEHEEAARGLAWTGLLALNAGMAVMRA